SDQALLLRSGRRWRAAPDEGASEASCSCPTRQHQKHASLRSRPLIRPPGTFSRKREKGFLPISRRKGRDPALLLRSGRRWRAAPDEGASAASLLFAYPASPASTRYRRSSAPTCPSSAS